MNINLLHWLRVQYKWWGFKAHYKSKTWVKKKKSLVQKLKWEESRQVAPSLSNSSRSLSLSTVTAARRLSMRRNSRANWGTSRSNRYNLSIIVDYKGALELLTLSILWICWGLGFKFWTSLCSAKNISKAFWKDIYQGRKIGYFDKDPRLYIDVEMLEKEKFYYLGKWRNPGESSPTLTITTRGRSRFYIHLSRRNCDV